MTKEKKQEYTLRISNANKTQMIEILYEILEEYLKDAIECKELSDREGFHGYLVKSQAVIRELIQSINRESEIAGKLFSLYIFFQKEISAADVAYDTERPKALIRLTEKLKSAYIELSKRDESGPVMKNAEAMFAGLTYGKESLVVHINTDRNRGYSV